MSEWEETTLGQVCSFKGGSAFPQVEQGNRTGVAPFIKVSDLSLPGNDSTISQANNWVSEAQISALRLSLFPAGSSVFAKIGEGMKSERVRRLAIPTAIDNNLMAAVPAPTTDPRFLYYLLQTVRLASHAVGSALPYLKQSTLQAVPITIPPLPEQQAIAEVLCALDDKIAANTALATTSWALIEAEFRKIQAGEGLERATLAAIAALEYGKALPTGSREPGPVPVVGSGGISGVHSTALVEQSGVVVGRKGSAGAVHWVSGPHFPIDTTFFVRGVDDSFSQPYLYFLLQTLRLSEMNNDSAVPGLNRAEALALPISVPTADSRRSFTSIAERLIALVDGKGLENRTLAATRDALLPQLMSGKLRVRDAERVASEAGA